MKKELERTSQPTIRKVDKSLDQYLDKGLFKDKIEKIEHIIRTVGLPKLDK